MCGKSYVDESINRVENENKWMNESKEIEINEYMDEIKSVQV